MNETSDLPINALKPEVAHSFADLIKHSSGSAAGYHAVSEWMTCPERARLKALGVHRIAGDFDGTIELNALDFGTLCHYIRALRVAYGHTAAMETLDTYRREIGDQSYLKCAALFGQYEQTVPRDQDSLEYLAIEPEVRTNIARPGNAPIIRSVRYDTLVYAAAVVTGVKELFSFEAKTMSRSGMGSIDPYNPQGMIQVALWNANPALVAKYGEMQGVIFDCLIKTKSPSTDRVPRYYSKRQQVLALEYMRLPEPGAPGSPTGVQFSVLPDGRFPRMLHSCWGRWSPCDFIDACHEDSWGGYADREGNRLTQCPGTLVGR